MYERHLPLIFVHMKLNWRVNLAEKRDIEVLVYKTGI